MSRIELVVFDWDGTLMDSAARIVAAVQTAVAAIGLEPRPDARVRSIIGLGLAEAIERLYPDATVAQREQLAAGYGNAHVRAMAEQPASLFPGAEGVLEVLAGEQRRLAVATGKSRAGLRRELERTGLASRFAATRTVDESPSKPDPDMLQAVMACCGVGPAETLMVGDTLFDLEMAARAGVSAIGVDWGVHERAVLEQAGPIAVLEQIEALPAHIRRLESETEDQTAGHGL